MGAIFEAEHVATERRVALKLLFPHIMSVASARQKFELEAKVSARVNSPYIVEVLDAGFDEASKSPYLVMELLEGQTLAARVRERGPLGVDEALRLLAQVAAGLDSAHAYKEASGAAKPIVHRDLKPENLFLTRQHDGTEIAKILDYGIAKVLGDTSHISQEVRGTPLFMAFEQITAGALSPQTDVWALGLIAYYMLTGARYWRSADRQGASVQSLFAEILTLPLEAPSKRLREQNVDVSLPPAFDEWLLCCIDREPTQRFATAGAAIEALERVFERAPRGAASQPSLPLIQPSDSITQTFIAADIAARAAAAAAANPPSAAPATAVGSVPALSATRHRRSFSARVMSSPLHWAAVGAVGGVFVLGGLIWLVTGDPSPPVAEPASAVQAARPAPDVAAPPVQPAPAQPAPDVASPARPSPGHPVDDTLVDPPAPRIRIAPLDETPQAGSAGGAAAEAASASGHAIPSGAISSGATASGATAAVGPGATVISGAASAESSGRGASGSDAESARPSSPAPATSSGGAAGRSIEPPAAANSKPAKRPRRPLGKGEAYTTR